VAVGVGEVGGVWVEVCHRECNSPKLHAHLPPVTKGFAKEGEEKTIEKRRVTNNYHV
jgi:hypothetical protein